jgi:hypothetical protein
VTERDYLAAEQSADHQDVPKFRRNENSSNGNSNRPQKRKSSASAIGIIGANSPDVNCALLLNYILFVSRQFSF